MQEELTAAFIEFFSCNRGAGGRRDYFGVRIDDVAPDGSAFDLTLIFKSGVRYCCAEPGCHTGFGLKGWKSWQLLREMFGRHGLADIPPVTIRRFCGVVEPGALLTCLHAVGMPEETVGYTYETGPYHERDA
jgi:hypothetical protein